MKTLYNVVGSYQDEKDLLVKQKILMIIKFIMEDCSAVILSEVDRNEEKVDSYWRRLAVDIDREIFNSAKKLAST